MMFHFSLIFASWSLRLILFLSFLFFCFPGLSVSVHFEAKVQSSLVYATCLSDVTLQRQVSIAVESKTQDLPNEIARIIELGLFSGCSRSLVRLARLVRGVLLPKNE